MNCYRHPNVAAVYACPKCNMGMCPDCCDNAFYKIDDKPVCHNCDKVFVADDLSANEKGKRKAIIGIIARLVCLLPYLYFMYKHCEVRGSLSLDKPTEYFVYAAICTLVLFYDTLLPWVFGCLFGDEKDRLISRVDGMHFWWVLRDCFDFSRKFC